MTYHKSRRKGGQCHFARHPSSSILHKSIKIHKNEKKGCVKDIIIVSAFGTNTENIVEYRIQ